MISMHAVSINDSSREVLTLQISNDEKQLLHQSAGKLKGLIQSIAL